MHNKYPLVSIIIPVKEINNYLRDENLPAFVFQTVKNFEVLVLPNMPSKDDSQLVSSYPWLRIIPTYKITRPAEKRDIGAKNAKGSILAFIDDDAYPAPEWLKQALHYFESKKTEVVCGPGILPQKVNSWEKIFDEILKSPMGSGGYQYRFVQKPARYIDDYPSMNFLIKKDVFLKIGGFDSQFWPGEDSKLCEDLVYKYEGKIYYDPTILVYHHRRDTLNGYLKQHANYGFHRGAFFAHGDRNSRRIAYLIPTFFTLYLLFLPFAILFTTNYHLSSIIYHLGSSTYHLGSSIYHLSFLPLLTYALLGLLLIAQSFAHTRNVALSLTTFPVLFLTHVVYGTMFIKGLIVGSIRKKKIY